MRNEDKARAHLQSAMKYLGFGMTPEQKEPKTPGYWRDGFDPFEDTGGQPAESLETRKAQDAKKLQLTKAKERIQNRENTRLSLHNTMKNGYKGRSAGGSNEV